jgi:hypothetical protein
LLITTGIKCSKCESELVAKAVLEMKNQIYKLMKPAVAKDIVKFAKLHKTADHFFTTEFD